MEVTKAQNQIINLLGTIFDECTFKFAEEPHQHQIVGSGEYKSPAAENVAEKMGFGKAINFDLAFTAEHDEESDGWPKCTIEIGFHYGHTGLEHFGVSTKIFVVNDRQYGKDFWKVERHSECCTNIFEVIQRSVLMDKVMGDIHKELCLLIFASQ